MQMFVERAATDHEIESIIRSKYGDHARIIARKEVKSGGVLGLFRRTEVEVTGYFSHAPHVRTNRGTAREERLKILESATRGGDRPVGVAERAVAVAAPGRDGSGARNELADNDGNEAAAPTSRLTDRAGAGASASSGAATPETTNAGGSSLDVVLGELRLLKAQLGTGQTSSARPAGLAHVVEALEDNDFSSRYIAAMEERMRRECTLDELENADRLGRTVVRWIAETISIYPWQERRAHPHVFVLVGPTGVGKTTTIAKLAAMYGAVADPPLDVRVLTIDSYRIGALHQIQKYCEIMNIPVAGVDSPDEMKRQLALHNDADFVFVDTIGKSPFDFGRLAEVNQLVRSTGGEIHLAVSATTKRADMVEILRQFEPFNYQSIVITKLDETSCVGGIISALHETRKSVSFYTDGQSVPQDIARAKVSAFLRRLTSLPGTTEVGTDD